MNKTAMQGVKKKYNAWKRYTRTKDYDHYVEYTAARNQATKEVRKAKKNCERSIAEETTLTPSGSMSDLKLKPNLE